MGVSKRVNVTEIAYSIVVLHFTRAYPLLVPIIYVFGS